jgi:hypothetical protein
MEPTFSTNSVFWSQFFGIILGSFFTLGGIWFTNLLSQKKNEKERKEQILESFQYTVAKISSYIALVLQEADDAMYFSQCTVVPVLKNEIEMNKEEFQRHTNVVLEAKKEMVELSGELNKCYATYKIYFGHDEALKSLIENLSKPLNIEATEYSGVVDLVKLKEIHASNQKVITKVIKEQSAPRKKALFNHLDKKIILIKKKKSRNNEFSNCHPRQKKFEIKGVYGAQRC